MRPSFSLGNTASEVRSMAWSCADSQVGARTSWPGPLLAAVTFALLVWASDGLVAQPPGRGAAGGDKSVTDLGAEKDEPRLIDRPPYDEMTLPNRSGQLVTVRIKPLTLEQKPAKGKDSLVEVVRPESKFPLREITWSDNYQYRSYADMLMTEARRLNAAGKDSEAFEYVLHLHNNYSDYPGLEAVEREFLYGETKRLFVGKEYDQAFAVVEFLHSVDPAYRETPSSPTMAKVFETTAKRYLDWLIETRRYAAARALIDRLGYQYMDLMRPITRAARDELIALSETEKAAALIELAEGNFRAARAAVRRMLNIWPDLEDGKEVAREVIESKQIVLVGVTDTSESARWNDLTDWAARRRSILTNRRLFEFTGFAAEQGEYEFIAGTRELSEDGRQWTLRLSPNRPAAQAIGTGYALATALRKVADPADPDYNPTWARLVDKIEVSGPLAVTVHFRQPHVLPQALLQVPLTEELFPPRYEGDQDDTRSEQLARLSPFVEKDRQGDEIRYERTRPAGAGGIAGAVATGTNAPASTEANDLELIEIHHTSRTQMVESFLRQELDVLDRVFPSEVERLKNTPGITVGQYELPSIHFLVCNTRNPFVEHRLFRRALLYAIQRDVTLNTVLQGNKPTPGSRVLSAPFPAVVPKNETIAYAYDERIAPRPNDPRLAFTLKELARQDLSRMAEARGEAAPELKELILVHPSDPIATAAAETLAEQWEPIGFPVKLKALPPGQTRPEDDNWDLLYVQAQVWEPLVDAAKVLDPAHGLNQIASPYIDQALWQMEVSRNWSSARPRLLEIHRVTFNELPILPLWQLMEHYAVQSYVRGVPGRQYTLYQEAPSWRLSAD